MNSKSHLALVAFILLAWTTLGRAQTVSPKRSCTQLLEFSAPGVEISKAEPVPGTDMLPANCLVQGAINIW
jgi:hypothetical protein